MLLDQLFGTSGLARGELDDAALLYYASLPAHTAQAVVQKFTTGNLHRIARNKVAPPFVCDFANVRSLSRAAQSAALVSVIGRTVASQVRVTEKNAQLN